MGFHRMAGGQDTQDSQDSQDAAIREKHTGTGGPPRPTLWPRRSAALPLVVGPPQREEL